MKETARDILPAGEVYSRAQNVLSCMMFRRWRNSSRLRKQISKPLPCRAKRINPPAGDKKWGKGRHKPDFFDKLKPAPIVGAGFSDFGLRAYRAVFFRFFSRLSRRMISRHCLISDAWLYPVNFWFIS